MHILSILLCSMQYSECSVVFCAAFECSVVFCAVFECSVVFCKVFEYSVMFCKVFREFCHILYSILVFCHILYSTQKIALISGQLYAFCEIVCLLWFSRSKLLVLLMYRFARKGAAAMHVWHTEARLLDISAMADWMAMINRFTSTACDRMRCQLSLLDFRHH